MGDQFLENQSRSCAPSKPSPNSSTSDPPVLGMMPLAVPSGMHPPVGLMPNVGNNYPNPQQIPLTTQESWTMALPVQRLQPAIAMSPSAANEINRLQPFSNSLHVSDVSVEGSNNNLNNVVREDVDDDDISLSDAPEDEDEDEEEQPQQQRSNDDVAIGGSDEEISAQPQKSNRMLLPKALEDVLAFKDQRAAEYDGDIMVESGVKKISRSDIRENNGGEIQMVGFEEHQDKEINSLLELEKDIDEVDGVELDSANETEDDENSNVNVNGATEQLPKSLQQSKSERNKRKKRRKKLNKKLKKQQKQQNQHLHLGNFENNVDNEMVKFTNDQEQKSLMLSNEEISKKTLGNDQEQFFNSEAKNASSKVDDSTSHNTDKHSPRHSNEKKSVSNEESSPTKNDEENVTIEYVPEKITIADLAPMYRQFYRVFEVFKLESKPKSAEGQKTTGVNEAEGKTGQKKNQEKTDLGNDEADGEDAEDGNKEEEEKLSKRKLKKLTRLSVAELKQLVSRPDVVEMHDVTARDPKLLVQLKAYRNTVQVPRHWCFKRKYLQGKRGIEKPPFDLPTFIKRTGIMEMRESLQERDEAKSLKMKMRERVRPKMGKIDIDYQKLPDAFFKWQTKPRMTIHGDLYYEGKEFETRLKEKKPGDLSEELRIALGMPVGPNSHKIPPPWLIAQQRYGPPPSYPNLKIPGLNAPIPDGCAFGYHAGGWGKPPVDENGKPLYGDVFGTNIVDIDNGNDEADIERNQWGELESESEESSEEEEEDGEDMANQADESGLVTPAEGLVTPSGLNSVPAGMETPDSIELRKKKIEQEMEDNETPVLYHVLPEKRTDRVGASMMGSTHVYDVATAKQPNVVRAATTGVAEREGTVELALDPSELDMDNDAMAQRYEQQMREQQSRLQKEDLSDMLAEHVARQKSKRKRQTDPAKSVKKYKEFKF